MAPLCQDGVHWPGAETDASRMKIVIAGGTGFLGHALAQALAADRHDVVVLTRDAAQRDDEAGARSLVAAIRAAATPPVVFVSGSAVGYYGPLGDELATEETAPGTDFLASVCVQWEAEAARAASPRTRVVTVRTGLVLEHDGGALPR